MPSKPNVAHSGASVLPSGADNKYLATFRDQHALSSKSKFAEGRPWWGWREFAANRGHVDGFNSTLWPGDHEIGIGSEWDAPWMPDPIWFSFDYRKNRIRIQYDRIITHYGQKAEEYYRLVNRACAKNGWASVQRGEMPRDSITDVYGDPPMSTRIFQAAQASHPWILGFTDEPDEELARLMGLTIPGAGIYNAPRKDGLISVEEASKLDENALDERIARAVAAALTAAEVKRKADHTAKTRAGVEKAKQTAAAKVA